MTALVTYHTPDMSRSADLCRNSALRFGCDKAMVWTRAAIEQTEFYEQNKALLDQPRGSGYWAWKPFIILEALKAGRDVVYADAGVEFINLLSYITSRPYDVFLHGNMYDHQHWCKGDIMHKIGVYPGGKQCQASVIFVKQSGKWFIEEWLKWCLEPGLIDDSPSMTPNHPEFQENRHDQAILTTLAYKHGIPLHWWPAMYNKGAFTYTKEGYRDNYPVMYHHHRRRDHEY